MYRSAPSPHGESTDAMMHAHMHARTHTRMCAYVRAHAHTHTLPVVHLQAAAQRQPTSLQPSCCSGGWDTSQDGG